MDTKCSDTMKCKYIGSYTPKYIVTPRHMGAAKLSLSNLTFSHLILLVFKVILKLICSHNNKNKLFCTSSGCVFTTL